MKKGQTEYCVLPRQVKSKLFYYSTQLRKVNIIKCLTHEQVKHNSSLEMELV